MARTQDEIERRVIDLAPRFVKAQAIGVTLLRALAASLYVVEAFVDEAMSWVRRNDAPSAWLDEIGATRGLRREAWETDEQFAARCFLMPSGPTRAYLAFELNRVIQPLGYVVSVSEPSLMFCDNDEIVYGMFSDDIIGLVYDVDDAPIYGVAVHVPLIEVVEVGEWFCDLEADAPLAIIADDTSDEGNMLIPLASDMERAPYSRIEAAVEALRAHATRVRVIFDESFQLAHHLNLIKTTEAYIF